MNDATTSGGRSGRFEFTQAWPAISQQDADELLAFWSQHGAIADPDQARARLQQVVWLARDGEGKIAGVCSALAMTPQALGQPMYFWRAFIAPQWRSTRLIRTLLEKSCELLEDYSRERDYPCIGILLELENELFRKKLRMAEWPHPRFRFVYMGKSPRGLDVRGVYFHGAQLK